MIPSLPLDRHFAQPGAPLEEAFSQRNLFPWIHRRSVPLADPAALHARLLATARPGKRVAYVHVPFCANHCLFCGFYRNRSADEALAEYAGHVARDIAVNGPADGGPIHAVYFGGGTPSALSASDLYRLVAAMRDHLPLAPDCEITIEGRVAGFDDERVDACLDAGANRFSIGVQTFDTGLRRRLGRKADHDQTVAFLERLCRRDRAAVVCDLIFGLPGQDMDMWRRDVRLCTELGLDGVDLYCLTMHDQGPLAQSIAKGALPAAAGLAQMARMYAAGLEIVEDAGWRHLNQAHWAATTRERNLYNQLVKAGADCLAFGSGAGGLLDGHRIVNDPDIESYQRRIAEERSPVSVALPPPPQAVARNLVMGGLEGGRLDLARLESAVVPGFTAALAPLFEQWSEQGLVRRRGNTITLTTAGWFWHTNLVGSLFELIAAAGASDIPVSIPTRKENPMSTDDRKIVAFAALRRQMELSQDGVLETIAEEHGVSTRDVVDCLPEHCRTVVDGAFFEAVMADLTAWGEITFLVHTKDIILECKGVVPSGKVARGFYNLDGHDAIGGHLRLGNCGSIAFVKRPFMKMDTCAILFFNRDGEAMFKVYVGRDDTRALKTDQIVRFDALRARLAAAPAPALAG